MGTTLTGTQINNTYSGLPKTADNAALGATEKVMGDGAGNDSTLSLGTASASFTGTLDLSGATVTGLNDPGLEPGTAANSMKSAAYLTSASPATATNTFAISLGYGSDATGTKSVSIGALTEATGINSTAIGHDSHATNTNTAAFVVGVYAQASGSLALGNLTRAESGATDGIAIGKSTFSRAENDIVIGARSVVDDAVRVDTVVLGADAKSAQYSTAVGKGSFAIGANCVAVGHQSRAAGNNASAFGDNATADYNNTTAIGYATAAVNWSDSVTVKKLAMLDYASLNFADDTAAASGGVPVSGIYHTAGTLKVRLV